MTLLHFRTALLALSVAALALTGCPGPDNEDPLPDAGTDAGTDAGDDGGDNGDGGDEPDPDVETGGAASSAQIQAVRDVTDENVEHNPALPVEQVAVTYIRPEIGSDPAGFFVQAEATGPALFVAVDPATIETEFAVGDIVSFDVTGTHVANDQHLVTAIDGLTVVESGFDVESLVQDLSDATDIVSGVSGYESELIQVSAHMAGDIDGCGGPNQCSDITTAGITAPEDDLRFRFVPEAIDVHGLRTGCDVVVGPSPMWRFRTTAQVSAFVPEDVTVVTCPDVLVTGAVAASSTSVQVTFDAPLSAETVTAEAFSISSAAGALAVTAATVEGNTVILTTAEQTVDEAYTLTVADTVKEVNDIPVAAGNSTGFLGYAPQAVVRINEFNAHISGGCDLMELRVVEGGAMAGYQLFERTSRVFTFPEGFEVQKNDLIVLHFDRNDENCTGGGEAPADELTAPDEQDHPRNYPGAFDFWLSDDGLTNTNNAYTLVDPLDNFVDFVLAAVEGQSHSGATATAANLAVDAGHWPAAAEPYTAANLVETAVLHEQPAGAGSVYRLNDEDTNTRDDWTQAEVGVSSFGALNVGQTPLP